MDSIESINKTLYRVKVRLKGNLLYLRATLPNKNGIGKKQQDIPTKLKNDKNGLKIALLRAQKLEADLNLEKFKWSDWIEMPLEKGILVATAVKQFEEFYWNTRQKTKSRENEFDGLYRKFLSRLPIDQPLTGELLRKYLVEFEPNSYYRQRCYLVYSAIAKYLDIPLPKEWKYLKGRYKSEPDRMIPTDEQIEETWKNIPQPHWQWIFGILATYGIRPHELFNLDLSRLPILVVKQSTKTGNRIVFPLYAHWVELFKITECHFFSENFSDKTNKELGAKISKWPITRNFGVVPYSLRDAYAIRGAKLGIDSLIMAKWMGHSLQVHSDHYLKFIDEIAMQKIWEKA